MSNKADTGNAHVRPEAQTKDAESQQLAAAVMRLGNDPDFRRVIEKMRSETVRLIENIQTDGAPETEQYERELCRTLRTLHAFPRLFVKVEANERLKASDFGAETGEETPHAPDE